MSMLPVGISSAEAGGYQISRSLRFNSADSAYLSRSAYSVASAGTQWTLSMWVKRSALGDASLFSFTATTGAAQQAGIKFQSDDTIRWWQYAPSTFQFQKVTTAVFRDVGAWYHLVFYYDTTLATAEDRLQIWVNGVRQTSFSTNTNPTQNLVTYYKTGQLYPYIGAENRNNTYLSGVGYNGYLTEINFIDGQALTPSSFGETDTDTGVWKPKKYSGTYGTNGFYLNFSDNSGTTSTTLGKDSSGNGNNWTPNNFSVTAGAGNDSLVDTPTNYGTDTGVGGEVRGNYATLNPLDIKGMTISDGNLSAGSTGATWKSTRSSISMSSGKWYWEVTVTGGNTPIDCQIGIGSTTLAIASFGEWTTANPSVIYSAGDGTKFVNGVNSAYGASYTTNDVIGVAFDADALTITFYKNNSSQGTITTGWSAGTYAFELALYGRNGGTTSAVVNFGQRPFAYTAPSGFKALCTQNLPEPTIKDGGDYFNTVLYTGNADFNSITTVGFQPDLVWVKERSEARDHILVDAVRTISKGLYSNLTSAEGSTSNFTEFLTNGFKVGYSGVDADKSNKLNQTYVAWNWKANGSGSSNTAGTITSTVSVNTTSGFSIVTYTGTGSAATVGHGLGVAPKMIIYKYRGGASSWVVGHQSFNGGVTPWNYIAYLDLTNAIATAPAAWNNTAPTSSVFSIGGTFNPNGGLMVAYCFAEVAGYSAFGSYTGNGSADGPFVYTGFRPKYLLIKSSSASATNWVVQDTTRFTYNLVDDGILANTSAAEYSSGYDVDILSNGFKIRRSGGDTNASGGTYIYAAFGDAFKFSLAR